jgi:serine/threonine-protein kinase
MGIVHRDLKPANVMLSREGRLKVVDFGIAKPDHNLRAESTHLTGAGLVLGTPAYMAPEQLKGEPIDHRADLFAYAVLVYELATGTRPFGGGSDADVVSAILRDPPPMLKRQRNDLPGQLQDILSGCFEKDPARRIDSATSVARALASLHGGDVSTAPAARPPIAAIAVLPLQEIGGHVEDLLADGITEALIADLARASGLKVISRTSVMRFRDSTEPLQEIARRLGVDALVTGSVRRSGNRIRISVELIEPASERVLWADRYDRELEDVLRLQDEMARAIADGVWSRVSQEERSTPTPRKIDPEVYLLDLKGRSQIELRTAASFRAALPHFRQALARDPSFGPSWLGIVRAYNMEANYGMVATREVRPEMETALARAKEFGADAAEVLGEAAQMRWQFDFDWAGAESDYRRALELAPNNARLWYWRGIALGTAGNFETAFDCLARAESLDPLSSFIRAARGLLLYFAGRLEDAIACVRNVIETSPDHASTYWIQSTVLAALGDYSGALASSEFALARMGRIGRVVGYFGYAAARGGRDHEARQLLAEHEQRSTTYLPAYFRAMVLQGLGDREAALTQLERAWAERESMLRELKGERVWDGLREEPRFIALMTSMRYPDQSAAATRPLHTDGTGAG